MLPSLYRLGLGWRVEVQLVGDLTKKNKYNKSDLCGIDRFRTHGSNPKLTHSWVGLEMLKQIQNFRFGSGMIITR